MSTKRVLKRYGLGGLDLVTPLEAADPNRARVCKNLVPHPYGGLAMRQGYKGIVGYKDVGGTARTDYALCGMGVHTRVDVNSNEPVTRLVCLGGDGGVSPNLSTFWVVEEGTITVAYNDVANPNGYCLLDVFVEPGTTFYAHMVAYDVGGAVVDSKNITLGDVITSAYTLANFKTQMETVTGVTVTLPTGVSTDCDASTIELQWDARIENGASTTLDFRYLTAIPLSYLTELADLGGLKVANGGDNGCLLPLTNLRNCSYFMSGFMPFKYDGKHLWPLGLSAPAGITGADSGAGNVADGSYRYLVTYEAVDYQGNLVESDGLVTTTITTSGGSSAIVLSSISRTGWWPYPSGASVAAWGGVFANGGTETGTTLAADDGAGGVVHVEPGAYIYFKDSVGTGHTRLVTAVDKVAPFGITISGAAVTVANNAPFSPIKVNVYRTQVGPSSAYYLVDTVAVDITAATFTYTDTKADASLGAVYVTPETVHDPYICAGNTYPTSATPPVKAIIGHQGLLLIGGKEGNLVRVYFSDIDSPEYFPPENYFDCASGETAPLTAFATLGGDLWVFKEKAIYMVTGELATGGFRVDLFSKAVGCSSHSTIQEAEGVLYWANSDGVWRSGGGKPEKISNDIDSVFGGKRSDPGAVQSWAYERAVSYYDSTNRWYVLYLPYLGASGDDRWATSSSRTFVYSLETQQWYEWDTINMAAGAALVDGDLYFADAAVRSNIASTVIYKRSNRGDWLDYRDNVNWITPNYLSHYETLGEHEVLKRPLRMRVASLSQDGIAKTTITVNTVLTMNAYKDWQETTSSAYSSCTFTPWNTSDAITETAREKFFRLLPRKVRAFAFGITNSSQHFPAITSVSVDYAVPYKAAFKEPTV